MAFSVVDEIEEEIRAAFSQEPCEPALADNDQIKGLFMECIFPGIICQQQGDTTWAQRKRDPCTAPPN